MLIFCVVVRTVSDQVEEVTSYEIGLVRFSQEICRQGRIEAALAFEVQKFQRMIPDMTENGTSRGVASGNLSLT